MVRQLPGTDTPGQRQYCDKPGTKKNLLTLDHIIPESKGGPTVVGNLVTACQQCNTRKTNQSLADFLAEDHSVKGGNKPTSQQRLMVMIEHYMISFIQENLRAADQLINHAKSTL